MDIRGEVTGAEFGDKRLSKRLAAIAEQLARAPGESFPKATGSDAALEATYRFLNNDAVTAERILEPHQRATVQRCAAAQVVFVAHDTTEFRFASERDGLGRLSANDHHGFLGHFALAVAPETRAPLGVLGLATVFRGARKQARLKQRSAAEERESYRWAKLADEVTTLLAGKAEPIHVMDREADAFELLAHFRDRGQRFVIRSQHDRLVETERGRDRLAGEVVHAVPMLEREVKLSGRAAAKIPGRNRKHPARDTRTAKLAFSAMPVTIVRGTHLPTSLPPTLTVNVVRVWEIEPPDGVGAVEWRLLTSEPVATTDDIAAVVDAYRARWIIEEYFKALKTGCAYEKRQLESRHALLNALALFASAAWLLLALRHLARHAPGIPADVVLSPTKLLVLQRHKSTKLHPNATVREAMLAIAQLGGHIKNNGEPGWIVLGRGYEDLLLMELGALAALGCDQS